MSFAQSLREQESLRCMCLLRLEIETALIHSQSLTLVGETGSPHLVSIPVTVLGFLKQMAESPLAEHRSVRLIGNECSKQNNNTSSEDFVSSGKCGVFWYLSLFHHTLPNTLVHSQELKTKQNARGEKVPCGIQGRNFSKKSSCLK